MMPLTTKETIAHVLACLDAVITPAELPIRRKLDTRAAHTIAAMPVGTKNNTVATIAIAIWVGMSCTNGDG
jgi:hypothetical protein